MKQNKNFYQKKNNLLTNEKHDYTRQSGKKTIIK